MTGKNNAMTLHVLSGDSLLEPFREAGIPGDVAVFRECVVDGPVNADSLDEFFRLRSSYLSDADSDAGKPGFYESDVIPEIEKILSAPYDQEICLWFEHELFCQVNLWFLLSEIEGRRVFVVSPPSEPFENRFDGWARLSGEDLAARFESRSYVDENDARLGAELWRAFRDRDGDRLRELAGSQTEIFRCLPEVAKAAAEIGRRPMEALSRIKGEGVLDFSEAFREFREREPAYGFGDLQVKRMWDQVINA
jgi:hypothetical protein